MRGADREDPVLDRLRGVMRVGCSGLCGNQPVCRVLMIGPYVAIYSSRESSSQFSPGRLSETAFAAQVVHSRGHYKGQREWACVFAIMAWQAGKQMRAKQMKPVLSLRTVERRYLRNEERILRARS